MKNFSIYGIKKTWIRRLVAVVAIPLLTPFFYLYALLLMTIEIKESFIQCWKSR